MKRATHVQEIYIRTSPEELWQAITDPQKTRLYWFGALSHSEWTPGARWTSDSDEGKPYLDGAVVEIEQPRRLVHTFHVSDGDAAADPHSRVTWEITPMGDACRLRLIHEDMADATERYITGGWEVILSGLKTLLETGQPLKIGEPGTM
jgi:uncharacterized protein YndB with AHSA1/START domain